MIYCVVPEPLAPDLYDKLVAYYADDPNVTVIVDRRKSERRDNSDPGPEAENRETRDRRRRRVPGEIPSVDTDPAA